MMSTIGCILCALAVLVAVEGATSPFASVATVSNVPACTLFGLMGVGNLDDNGVPDLAIPCSDGNKVALLKNPGLATLPMVSTTPTTSTATCANPTAASIGDYFPPPGEDLILSCTNLNAFYIPNNDNGVFGSAGSSYSLSCGSAPLIGLWSEDLSGDGRPDFVTACPASTGLRVSYGTSSVPNPAGDRPHASCTDGAVIGVTFADLDGSNGKDAIYGCNSDHEIRRMTNKGATLGFNTESVLGPAGQCLNPIGLTTLDLKNGDQIPDFVVACYGEDAVKLYTSTSSTWTISTLDSTCTLATAVTAADLNGDGKVDIVAQCSTSVRLYLAAATTGFETAIVLDSMCGMSALGYFNMIIADFTNDTKPDLIYTCIGSGGQARVMMHKSVSPPPPPPMPSPPRNDGENGPSGFDHEASVRSLKATVVVGSVFVATAYGLVYWSVAISPFL